jgi:hypothetical protein
LLKILLAALLIVAAMVAIKNGRVLRDAGLTGSCGSITKPVAQTGTWKACKRGRLEGRPDLSRQGCTAEGVAAKLQYWRCPAQLGSARGT